MVWNFDVSYGFNIGMPFSAMRYGFGMPNYLFIQPMNYTNPIQLNNYQFNPIFPKCFQPVPQFNFDFSNFNSFSFNPFWTNNNILEQYSKPAFSAAEQIASASSTISSPSASSSVSYAQSTSDSSSKSITTNSASNDPLAKYNSNAGNLLAQKALELSHDFHNQCSAHVNRAIEAAGLGMYTDADAYQMINIMKLNPNFASIPNTTDVKKLPTGCVVVYDRGVAGYSDEFGHIEIATGDGRGVSDGITDEIRENPSAIFMPI